MFSLIRPAKVEGHGGSAGHIHHSQGGKLLQLLRKRRANRITEVREAEEESVICKEVQMTPGQRKEGVSEGEVYPTLQSSRGNKMSEEENCSRFI